MDFRDVVRRHLASPPGARGVRQQDDDPEMVDELAQHLADLYREGRGAGLEREAALARAVAALPENPHTLKREMSRGMAAIADNWADRCEAAPAGRLTMLSDLRRDLRYSVRMLAHTPAFTLVVVLTLALGIGANASIFSAVDAILLRDAPVADPDRVVSLYTSSSDGRATFGSSSYPDYLDLRDSGTFASLAAYGGITVSFEGRDASEQLTGEIVSGNFFDVLGVSPVLGRAFAVDEDRAGVPARVAVVSNGFWRRSLGSDPGAVGRAITLNGTAHTVIGVAPPGFAGPVLGRLPEIWVPMAEQAEMRPPSAGVPTAAGTSEPSRRARNPMAEHDRAAALECDRRENAAGCSHIG